MLNMTLEQQTEVARIVTQQPWKYLHGHVILDGDEKLHYWNPSLTGEDWQLAQACRVIVAAFNLRDPLMGKTHGGEFSFSYWPKGNKAAIVVKGCPNLLHASALALLGDKT